MSIQKQCCTSEQAFKLKSLGVNISLGNFYWEERPMENGLGYFFHFQKVLLSAEKQDQFAPAFTGIELGVMLNYDSEGDSYPFNADLIYYIESIGDKYQLEAHLRAQILIHGISIGWFKVADVNDRLSKF